jgi:hypothetical protein
VEAILQLESSSSAEVVHRFVCRHERALLESGRPASVLSTIERLQESSPNLRFDKRLRRIQSRLSLEAGEYRRALEVSAGSLSLPQDVGALSDIEMEQILSLVDSAYRADPVVDREELSRFVSSVATTQRLPEGIRMRAAEIGLTIAANTCDVVTANTCYHTVFSGKTASFDELDDQSIRLALLYHAIFGNIDIAESIATSIVNRFDTLERSTTTVIDVGRAAFALRLCGNTELARKGFCTQLDLATKLSAPRLAQYSVWQLSQLELDAGNLREVDGWNSELERLLESDNDPISSSFATAHLCRCAIEAGNERRAFELLDEVKEALPRFPTHKSAAYVIALELGANLISNEWIPSKAIIEVAVERHRFTSRFGTTDYLTSTIADCLARIEGREVAASFIEDYLNSSRRERSTPSATLSRSIHRNRQKD